VATEVLLPKLGLTQEEGTIVRWLKREGGRVTKGEPLFEVMTDKATLEVEAPASGVLLRILVPEGGAAPVAAAIALIGEPGEAWPVPAHGGPQSAAARIVGAASAAGAREHVPTYSGSTDASGTARGRIKISPRARALAASRGIDARTLVGTGPGGRIVERDVRQALASPATVDAASPAAPARPAAAAAPGARPASSAPSLVAARMRTVIARRMVESLRTTAQLTLTTEVDMAEAARLREEIGPELERREGARPTYTDLVVRAAALSLRDHPEINARWENEGVRRLEEIHIGVAVALEGGLIVPVIRDAGRATLAQIAAAVRDLSERARAMRLRPDDVEGGTFTVTNLGMFEIDAFTPILNPPEAAILGVGRVQRKPIAVGDRVEIRPAMMLSLTFDHRVVDGAPAARFLQGIKHVLEHPYLLLLP
jgi:pyruvate dehydrogenase E2 component (dihydrolipoamide acetyltransferase)